MAIAAFSPYLALSQISHRLGNRRRRAQAQPLLEGQLLNDA